MAKRIPKIVVAGDVAIDWLEVSIRPRIAGQNPLKLIPNWQLQPGVRRIAKRGGALLLADLIKVATGIPPVTHGLANLANISFQEVIHSIVELDKFAYSSSDKEKKVYRVSKERGYSGPSQHMPDPPPLVKDDLNAEVVVLDDAGNGFREAKQRYWPRALLKKGKQPIIIYKMSRPLAKGALWETVKKAHARRLVIVINANDLREEGGNISRRLSWERTAKGISWQDGRQAELLSCDNLIVCFGIEGAMHLTRRRNRWESHLYFDPELAEDGFREDCPGNMLGLTNAFVAALTNQIVKKGLDRIGVGIAEGLRSARRLFREGFGPSVDNLDYPIRKIFRKSKTDPHIAHALVPNPMAPNAPDDDLWCILKDLKGASLELAAIEIALHGEEAVLKQVPVGQFGSLKFVDRNEIESFRVVKNLMQEYLQNNNPKRPLSIAVFGPPGSGKSLGVSQVAKSIKQGQVEEIKCNMAQFTSLGELVSVFHKVRNTNLRREMPLVFFDEFDSDFNGKHGWLKYFLAPMQDGEFKDGETMHPIGKAIFVFAGGTSSTYQEFYKVKEDNLQRQRPKDELPDTLTQTIVQQFKDAKGPDFVSRLRGIVNILGPNQVDANDNFFPIRRAMALRYQMNQRASHLFKGREMQIDYGVLRALMRVPKYEHGLRSMEAILDMSLLSEYDNFEQAALPPKDQINLHTDGEIFLQLVARDVPAKDLLLDKATEDLIAKAIHEQYRKDHKGIKPDSDPAMDEWELLSEGLKESNRQQAKHIKEKLRRIGYDFRLVAPRKAHKARFNSNELEILAEMEHERWVAERLLDGWRLGPRDPANKVSPHLIKWDELAEDVKDYDRKTVRSIPEFMALAGFEIYRL